MVEGAGGVDEDSAGLQGGPDVCQDTVGAGGAEFHGLRRPFVDGLLVLAEHAFAGAGDIGHDGVEYRVFSEGRRVARYGAHAGVSPGFHVAAEDGVAVAHDFVGQQGVAVPEAFPQGGGEVGGLSAGGGAQIQHAAAGLQVFRHLTEHVADKHGRCVLHVVAARMEERVQRKDGAFIEKVAVGAPGHSFGLGEGAFLQLGGVQADGDRRSLFQRRRYDIGPACGGLQQFDESFREHPTWSSTGCRSLRASCRWMRPRCRPRPCPGLPGSCRRASSSS